MIWGRNLGVPNNPYGHCSSLVTFEDLLLVQLDHEDEGRFMGLETRTGRTRWEAHREFGASWSSPLVAKIGDEYQAILSANPMVISYNPRTGKELWRLECLGGEVAPMPVLFDGMIYVAADYIKIAAIDAVKHEVVWHQEVDIPGVSTPLLANGLYIAGLSDAGISCRDAKTGEEVWFQETDDGFYSSPVLVGNNVYMMDRGGTMHIFAAEREFKPVGTAVLDEQSVATPVFMDGAIFYRSYENLFRIGA
jgi:outer membrane protein assembly factor BamB